MAEAAVSDATLLPVRSYTIAPTRGEKGNSVFWYDSRRRRNRARFQGWEARGLDDSALAIPIAAIRELQERVLGDVLLPGDKGYEEATHVANPRFQFHPDVIVMCVVASDVAACLEVIEQFGIDFSIRSGGHNTAGYSGSNTMILDLSRLVGVFIDPVGLSAYVQPGCDWGRFNRAAEAFGLHLPGGACPDVCQGGYMQGGGYGFTARIFGMNCDQPDGLVVMLADRRIVVATPEINSDLFWAMRGTGNNFGVLLATAYPLRQGDQFLGFSVGFDLTSADTRAEAAAALSWMQDNFVRSVPQELGFQMVWVFEGAETGPLTPSWRIMGMYDGEQSDLETLLAPLLAQPGAGLQYYTGPMTYSALNEWLMTHPYEVPEFPPDIHPDPPAEDKVSRYITQTLAPDAWLTLMNYFVDSPNPYTTVAFEAYGGAISAQPDNLNAFIHRAVDFDCFMDVFWLKPEDEPVMEGYLNGWKEAIAPYWTGQVYQNYPSDDDTNFAAEYWGAEVYANLRQIKTKYDPNNVFRFPQSIPPVSASEPEVKDVSLHPGLREPIAALIPPRAPGSS
jgi:hypothetical protein